MVLFKTNGVITPKMDKTNICHTFDVCSGIKRLIITFKYSPIELDNALGEKILKEYFDTYNEKQPEDLTPFLPVLNLVTLSVDDECSYRGAGHRCKGEQKIVIANENSSYGFLNGKINAGQWDIVLNVHCAKSDIDYEICVEGE